MENTNQLTKSISEEIVNKQFSTALSLCDKSLAINNNSAEINAQKAWCLHKLNRSKEARTFIDKAIQINLNDPCVIVRACDYLWAVADYKALIEICHLYLEAFPQNASVWQKLGASNYYLGNHELAEQAFRRSLQADSTNTTTIYNLGLALMHLGKYKEGLSLYEARIDAGLNIYPINDGHFSIPRWQGQPLQGMSVLVWCEQGLGDIFQFVRFVPIMANQGAKVSLLIGKRYKTLQSLLATVSGVNQVYLLQDNSVLPDISASYHYHCPVMSAMHGFSLMPDTIPATIPYITSPVSHQPQWLNLTAVNTLKTGLVWNTKIMTSSDATKTFLNSLKNNKNLSFSEIEPLFTLTEIAFVNLKFPTNEIERESLKKYNVIDYSQEIKNFTDTAAIINQLDLVVTIDTSVAHLAGAMGKPVILMLPYISDWRWQKNRDDSPWYPTMRLYRQIWKGDWEGVIDRVKATLARVSIEYQQSGKVNIFG